MVPVGVILPFYGGNNSLPPGYLFCDGGMFTRVQFPELYSQLTLANGALRIDAERAYLPDLRGEFIRGWSNNRPEVDQGRTIGSWQQDEFRRHCHQVSGWVQFWTAGAGAFNSSPNGNADQNIRDPYTTDAGGIETRPRNVAVNFIIKATRADL